MSTPSFSFTFPNPSFSFTPFPGPSFTGPPRGRPSPTPFNSIFQSPGGPPLILVCIAAGLLLGALIGVLIMRRLRPNVVVQRVGAGRRFGLANLGEKPKLLDIHIAPRAEDGVDGTGLGHGGVRDGERWTCVAPFAAVYLPDPSSSSATGAVSSSSPSASSSPSPATSSSSAAQRVSRILTRLRRSTPRPAHAPHASPASAAPPRRVQLAVTVSMPDPRQPVYVRLPQKHEQQEVKAREGEQGETGQDTQPHERTTNDLDVHEDPMPDCCIGTVVVQYSPPPDEDADADAEMNTDKDKHKDRDHSAQGSAPAFAAAPAPRV